MQLLCNLVNGFDLWRFVVSVFTIFIYNISYNIAYAQITHKFLIRYIIYSFYSNVYIYPNTKCQYTLSVIKPKTNRTTNDKFVIYVLVVTTFKLVQIYRLSYCNNLLLFNVYFILN